MLLIIPIHLQHIPTISSVFPSSCTLMLTLTWSTLVKGLNSLVFEYSLSRTPHSKLPCSDVSMQALQNYDNKFTLSMNWC